MSLKCPKCQGTLYSIRAKINLTRELMDEAMHTCTRPRACACGFRTVTVEMPADDLSELRRMAYLYKMSEVRG